MSAGRPAWLVHTTGHYGVANTAALEIAGITRETKDPPGGVIDRDAAGNPTGVLKETAMALVASHIPRAQPDQMREGIRAMAGELNRECMTGVKDPGIGSSLSYNPEVAMETWNAYRDVLAEGALTVRVFALWHSPRKLDDARKLVRLIEPFGRAAAPAVDDRLVSGGVKMFADGSGAARTAWTWQDWYRDRDRVDVGNRGYPAFDAELMRELILLYHDAGLHVGAHAVGDRAIDWVVDSYAERAEAQAREGAPSLDHPREHPERSRPRRDGGDAEGLRRGLPGAIAVLHLVDRRHLRQHLRSRAQPPSQSVRDVSRGRAFTGRAARITS